LGFLLFYIAACFAVALGVFTRVSVVFTFWVTTSYLDHCPAIFTAADWVLVGMQFLLIFSPAGEELSVDRWLRSKRPSPIGASRRSPWAQRLMQILLTYIYFNAFLHKIGSPDWIDGSLVHKVMAGSWFRRGDWPWLYQMTGLMSLFTWGSLVVEGFILPFLLWFRQTRLMAIAVGVSFHLMIHFMMMFQVFELIMMAAFILFLQEEDFTRLKLLWHWLQRRYRGEDIHRIARSTKNA
jgi:hypothetical protein